MKGKQLHKKKALVISGGGAWGAWGGGTIQGLYDFLEKEYDLLVGTSTGSLLAPLASMKQMEKLREGYTSVTQKDIFDVNPFSKKGGLNARNALYRILILNTWRKLWGKSPKPSLGESNKLRETIKRFFSKEDFDKLREEFGKEIIVAVVNLNTRKAEHPSSNDWEYEDFVDWMWISACAPPWMSLVKKNGCEYVDGGIIEHTPIQAAIDNGADVIDAIVHRPQEYVQENNYRSENILKLFMRVTDIMHQEISDNDLALSKLIAKNKDVEINVYYTPYKLSKNALMFDKKVMDHWWELGYNGIKDGTCVVEKWIVSSKSGVKRIK